MKNLSVAVKALALGAAICAAMAAEAAKTLYVVPSGDYDLNTSDCLTWEKGGTFSNAVRRAANGDTILFRAGTVEKPCVYDYSDPDKFGTGNYLSGQTTAPANLTIASEAGDLDPRKCIVVGCGKEKMTGFCTLGTVNQGLTVKGLTITNFFINTRNANADWTGVLYANGGNMTLTNCTVTGCGKGSNVNNIFSSGRYRNCDFIANSASVCAFAQEVRNCRFTKNSGVCVTTNSKCYDCTFRENTATVWASCYSGIADDCHFIDNAGAVMTFGAGHGDLSFTATRCTFSNNGGTISLGWRSVLKNCTIRNSSHTFMSWGSATDCVFTNNTASPILGESGRETIAKDCIFTDNKAGCKFGISGTSFSKCLFVSNELAAVTLFTGCTLDQCLVADNKIVDTEQSAFVAQGCTVKRTTIARNDLGAAGIAMTTGPGTDQREYVYDSIVYGNTPCDMDKSPIWSGADWYMTLCDSAYGTDCNQRAGKTAKFSAASSNHVQVASSPFNNTRNATYPWGCSLKSKSPARERGRIVPAADETDFAGLARLNGEHTDSGCYEYWPQSGLLLFIR